MDLDAYKERQDRAFDTFRSKYRLHEADDTTTSKTHAARSSLNRPTNGRTMSTSTFDEATGQVQEVDNLEIPTTQLMFAPQIRKLEIAPWEDAADVVPADVPKKAKKSRASILKKLRRVTSAGKTIPATETLPEEIEVRPESESAFKSTGVSAKTPAKTIYSSYNNLPRRSDIPLGRPLNTSEVKTIHEAIAFQPIDPNILHLKTPASVSFAAESGKGMKPSKSTPQIDYEVERQTSPADRMSRMFDSLQFD